MKKKKKIEDWSIKKKIGYTLPDGNFVPVMDYNEAGLWIYYLMGKYAGKTVGDAVAEHVLEIERPFKDFPNCWIIYEKETKI